MIFSVNIEELDRHHKRPIEIISDLHDAKIAGIEHTIIGERLDDLLIYVNTHFASEEELMEEYRYPEFDKHKSQHKDLLEQALSIIELYSTDGLDVIATLTTLFDMWLNEYIIDQDKKYGAHINSIKKQIKRENIDSLIRTKVNRPKLPTVPSF